MEKYVIQYVQSDGLLSVEPLQPTLVVSGTGLGGNRYRVTAEDIRTHRVTLCGPHGVQYQEIKDESGEVVELKCSPPCFFRVLPNGEGEPRRDKNT